MWIMGFVNNDGHVDSDLCELFIKEKIYLNYDGNYLSVEQLEMFKIKVLFKI